VTRSRLLERALLASGAIAFGIALDDGGSSALAATPSRAQDVRILNFLLLLEYLQEGFYSAAASSPSLKGEVKEFARIAADQERAHVELLERELGKAARPRPRLRFDNATRSTRAFLLRAIELEETATAAMIGEAANLTTRRIPTAARIVSVDARHAAWLRAIAGEQPAPRAADPAKTAAAALATVKRTGFVVRS
jgi:hypothetical protein